MAETPELVTLTINGRDVQAPKGASLLHVCNDAGAPVPYFCDHRKLEPIGACRMCVVQIEKQPKLATACTVTASEGMVVSTESPDVLKAREGVLEFLLINHPLDCPVCDKGGECDLQDFSFYHGPGNSRFIEEKVKYPKPVPLSEHILLDMERCVLCERCVRFFDEVTQDGQLVLLNRGVHTMIGTFNGEPMDSAFQGNIMELCPVGALTSADWRFSARPWDLRSTPSICHGCAVGCSVDSQTRDDRMVRYMSRDNPHVDDGWLCDRGRYGFHFVHDVARVLGPTIGRAGDTHAVTHEEAVATVAERLQKVVQEHGAHRVGALASPEATNEELFLFQRWIREVVGSPNLDHRTALEPHAAGPEDWSLAIDDFEACDVIFILGDQATLDLGPILELRLKKARRKAGTRLVLGRDRSLSQLIAEVGGGDRLVGVVAPEGLASEAAALTRRLGEAGVEARRLVVPPFANSRGAADMGCLPDSLPGYVKAEGRPGMGTWEMIEAAGAGQLKALVVMGPAPMRELAGKSMVHKALGAVDLLVALDLAESEATRAAHVVIPVHSFAEKDGTYTNLEGRVQRLRQAIPPVAKTPPDWRLLQDLANGWEAGWAYRQPAEVMRDIIAAVPAYGIERAGDRARWPGTAAEVPA
ncbi:MAG: NADH-quinone oxidoreductase subunit [Chloroflexota bacterium]|jgi:NADH-quinone oxidoreductase subunit G|nr:NADH-quinone oxidoreductase subunit [Chloroflexota bacterium]